MCTQVWIPFVGIEVLSGQISLLQLITKVNSKCLMLIKKSCYMNKQLTTLFWEQFRSNLNKENFYSVVEFQPNLDFMKWMEKGRLKNEVSSCQWKKNIRVIKESLPAVASCLKNTFYQGLMTQLFSYGSLIKVVL